MDGMDMGANATSTDMEAASSAMHMDHVHTCEAVFDPSKPYHYGHGAYTGHMLPGYFFLVWGSWWAICIICNYLKANTARQEYVARTWFEWPCAPQWMARLPLEPFVKIAMPFVGINGELWAGHESWRNLYKGDGTFEVDNLNDWQHSCMYFAFMASGIVDLIGSRRRLPGGTQRSFLALAFLVEGILLGFHLKGPDFEVVVHKLLVFTILATALMIGAEGALPNTPFVSLARAALVILQGTWFMQIAVMMYDVPFRTEWHPCYMGSAMFAPVVFSMHVLVIFLVLTIGLVLGEWLWERCHPGYSNAGPVSSPRAHRYHKVGNGSTLGGSSDEAATLVPHHETIEMAAARTTKYEHA